MSDHPPQLRVSGHHHLAIQVQDLPRAERFYIDVLGLRVLRRWPWSADDLAAGKTGERSLWISVGADEHDEFIALEACDAEPFQTPFRDPHGGLHLLALRISAEGRAGWEEFLGLHGVEIVNKTRWTVYVRDPEGNRIGLSHYPDEAAAP
jgi:glyoxylase I family protein